MKNVSEKKEEGLLLIGGDFKAKIGVEGNRESETADINKGKKSKGEKGNAEGEKLFNLLKEKGWSVLNGAMIRDEDGELTYNAP